MLYSAFTYYTGFKVNSGEYKLMGLAPYGNPIYEDKVRKLIDLKADGTFRLDQKYFNYATGLTMTNEKFDDLFLLNFFSGKSWKIDNYYIGVIVSVNNILDNRYKSGGYEQSRNANFNLLKEDIDSSSRIFGPRYWYGYGRTYYLNIYFRF